MQDVFRGDHWSGEFDRKATEPRSKKTYRAWRRNNAIKWRGVEAKEKDHPPLIKVKSTRGEVHFTELW